MNDCPCGLGPYETCCKPFLTGNALPETPEALMRSRYTAYTQAEVAYIGATQAGPAAEDFHAEDTRRWALSLTWDGLEVLHSEIDGDKGFVRFDAHYHPKAGRKGFVLSEHSEFRRVDGRWMYWDALPPERTMPINEGRNASCACGSGKKFKRCCGR